VVLTRELRKPELFKVMLSGIGTVGHRYGQDKAIPRVGTLIVTVTGLKRTFEVSYFSLIYGDSKGSYQPPHYGKLCRNTVQIQTPQIGVRHEAHSYVHHNATNINAVTFNLVLSKGRYEELRNKKLIKLSTPRVCNLISTCIIEPSSLNPPKVQCLKYPCSPGVVYGTSKSQNAFGFEVIVNSLKVEILI
jgi:hypothetical protein